jgi:hypothetical protein
VAPATAAPYLIKSRLEIAIAHAPRVRHRGAVSFYCYAALTLPANIVLLAEKQCSGKVRLPRC